MENISIRTISIIFTSRISSIYVILNAIIITYYNKTNDFSNIFDYFVSIAKIPKSRNLVEKFCKKWKSKKGWMLLDQILIL